MMMKEGSLLRIIIAVTLTLLLSLLTVHPPNFCTAHSDSVVRCIESERHALLYFKQHLTDPSNRLASWSAASNVDCCHWVGVLCHNVTGHVLQLRLRSFPPVDDEFTIYDEDQWKAQYEAYWRSTFGGKINPSLLDLKHLIYLDLSYNNFSGIQIPKFLGSMGSLRYLNLSGAGFGGKINPSLLDLKHLIYLDLSYNNFRGIQIPKFLGSMGSLRYLNLSDAGFVGLIPHQLGNLSNLHYLNLEYNDLYVKNLQWLSGLPLLQHLDLSSANLSQASDWLQEINKLPSLSELRLLGCELSASIPPPIPSSINFSSLTTLHLSSNYLQNTSILFWVFGLHNLVSLDLSDNWFQGPIPVHLQNLTSLRHLDLSWNNFNSSIPNWLYSFRHLEFLNLGYNFYLHGTISSAIGNLTSVISIDLSYNELEGKVPRSLGNLCNLREITLSSYNCSQEISEIFEILLGCVSNRLEILDLSNAQLSGQLTDELGQFKNLVILSLGYNSISGPIPLLIGNLSSLRSLDLGSNQINGTFPPSFGQLSKLEYLNIESNILEGVVSEVHFAKLTKLTTLLASRNQLTLEVRNSWIPPFQLNYLYLRSWNLGPRFPLWLLSQKHLQYLDISNTRVSDAVPPLFWNLSSQFMYLNLSHNQIYGEIPNIPMILSTSLMIDMSSNHFNGSLPCISSNVSILDLSDNLLSGSISHFLCYKMNESKKMSYLNLGKNLLSGEIIGCWMKWKNLNALNLGNNHLSGSIPRSIGSLIDLQSLHLYNNKFSGKLPSSLKNCKHLVTIDIGKNEFVGSIPSWMGRRFSSLMILSLHSNSFYGYIPEKLCSLTSLQILDLSNNKLFGSIPRCVNNFSAMATNNNSNVPLFLYDQPTRYGESWVLESALVVIKGKVLEYSTTLQLVKSIDLSKNNLSGEIPKEVTSLQGLQSLNLSFNILRGRIPDNIGVMGSLESIDFSVNQLSSQIPQSMSSMTFLSQLNLSNNNLSGKIPLSTQLQSLNASCFIGNRLCGAPLIEENCSIIDVKPNVENKRSKDFGGPEVDWFYVSMAVGFVVGFWVVLGPLLLNKQVRIMYFQFLVHLWFKLWGFVAQAWLHCK